MFFTYRHSLLVSLAWLLPVTFALQVIYWVNCGYSMDGIANSKCNPVPSRHAIELNKPILRNLYVALYATSLVPICGSAIAMALTWGALYTWNKPWHSQRFIRWAFIVLFPLAFITNMSVPAHHSIAHRLPAPPARHEASQAYLLPSSLLAETYGAFCQRTPSLFADPSWCDV